MTEAMRMETYRTDSEDVRLSEDVHLERSQVLPEGFTEEQVQQLVEEASEFPQLPLQIIEKYADMAARRYAALTQLDNGEWFAKAKGFPGVWASEESEEQAVKALQEVLFDWTVLKIEHKDRDLPVIEDIDLNVL